MGAKKKKKRTSTDMEGAVRREDCEAAPRPKGGKRGGKEGRRRSVK